MATQFNCYTFLIHGVTYVVYWYKHKRSTLHTNRNIILIRSLALTLSCLVPSTRTHTQILLCFFFLLQAIHLSAARFINWIHCHVGQKTNEEWMNQCQEFSISYQQRTRSPFISFIYLFIIAYFRVVRMIYCRFFVWLFPSQCDCHQTEPDHRLWFLFHGLA